MLHVMFDGEYEDRFLDPDQLAGALVNWKRGVWVEPGDGEPDSTYELTWVPVAESATVARRELGMDVNWIRRHP